uniref:Dirigent protein n=1 Tax=Steinernema glaseri TaxID=37863 RepID=A0A1I7XW83_9BILA
MAFVVGSEAVVANDAYRSQYVVLAFQTDNVIQDPQADLSASKGDLSVFLVNSTCSREIGPPIAGTMLWV